MLFHNNSLWFQMHFDRGRLLCASRVPGICPTSILLTADSEAKPRAAGQHSSVGSENLGRF